jgi:hypothetical protein
MRFGSKSGFRIVSSNSARKRDEKEEKEQREAGQYLFRHVRSLAVERGKKLNSQPTQKTLLA